MMPFDLRCLIIDDDRSGEEHNTDGCYLVILEAHRDNKAAEDGCVTMSLHFIQPSLWPVLRGLL
jgi:hypothetical protein